jgi:HEAT repeat protein
MSRSLLYILTLQCALAVAAIAQTDESAEYDPQLCSNLTTASQCVAENFALHHIPLTKDGLILALHGEDISLRMLAVYEVAEEGIKEAIPDLHAVFEAETDPNARICVADALAKLGDQRGIQTLEAYCDDKTAPLDARLNAAARLLNYQPKSCSKALLEGLQDDVYRGQALSMIPRFKELSPNESAHARAILLKSLSGGDSGVRLTAAGVIAEIGDVSNAPALEAAIAKEADPQLRRAMEYYLKALQSTQP